MCKKHNYICQSQPWKTSACIRNPWVNPKENKDLTRVLIHLSAIFLASRNQYGGLEDENHSRQVSFFRLYANKEILACQVSFFFLFLLSFLSLLHILQASSRQPAPVGVFTLQRYVERKSKSMAGSGMIG